MNNTKYKIIKSKVKEQKYVTNKLIEFNNKHMLFTRKPTFIYLNFVIKDDLKIIAGINSMLYFLQCLYIDILWVDENYRKQGLGMTLLRKVEEQAKKKGCHLIHLSTFDWQAKDFYIKHGFEIFGELQGDPKGHTSFFMKKNI